MPWHRLHSNTDRHNQVASIIHWDICRHFGVSVESRWYRHHHDRLVETDDITMMWDTVILTARKIVANCPDICFRNKKTNICLLIDISCPTEGNIARKQAEKSTKYSDLRVKVSTGCSSGVGSTGHSARRYCTVARHYSRSSQPAALTESSASCIQSNTT